ncbi:hypothetical protein MNB_SV-10-262 [hydrothermal vent metagenome]|uniref:Uncharacterized protein n=1 Tax=hydrothermal vent metagenome TaxID=652676 RepID=A0A1W1CJH7_9ZZZZ
MKKILIILMLCGLSARVCANENNSSGENNRTKEAVRKAMELEKKYAKEQRFYSGDEYDFKGAEVNKDSLKSVPVIKPDYDFDMDTGVYDD